MWKQLTTLQNYVVLKKIRTTSNDFLSFRKYNKKTLYFLKKNIKYKLNNLITISAIDYLKKKNHFLILYHFLSLNQNFRLCLKLFVIETLIISSISDLYQNAYWCEREIWDLFGIEFDLNLDLRRLLNDYFFEGFSLRKDFPLYGYLEYYYSEIEKQIKLEPISINQDLRFD